MTIHTDFSIDGTNGNVRYTGQTQFVGVGTITCATNSTAVTGVGTRFARDISVGATLYRDSDNASIGVVASITDDLNLVLNANASVAVTAGDYRVLNPIEYYTVLQLHQWLQDLADDASSSGNDQLDILSPNPSKLDGPRDAAVASRLNLLTDGSIAFNIDDTASEYINFGSIKQNDAGIQYSGLKTIGGIVANSPIYVVQRSAKLSKFWGNDHVQILVKVKTVADGVIDGGDVTAFSRKFGQTYSHFDVNLAAGGETSAALATAIDSNMIDPDTGVLITETKANGFGAGITLAYGDFNQDLDNGNGTKLYKGKITLDHTTGQGNITLQKLYQYLQNLTKESSTGNVNSIPGWRFRALVQDGTGTITAATNSTTVTGSGTSFTTETAVGRRLYDSNGDLIGTVASIASNTSLTLVRNALVAVSAAAYKTSLGYTENSPAPFGTFAGGTFFFAQGWYVDNVLPAESTNYVLTAHDATIQNPPTTVSITIGNLLAGDRVLVAREDTGNAGQILKNEYTPDGTQLAGSTTLTVQEPIKADTPSAGVIRIKGARYEYSSYNASTKTFTLTSGLLENIVAGDDVFVPYIDTLITTGNTSATIAFKYSADFSARIDVRNGTGDDTVVPVIPPIIPFNTLTTVTNAGALVNASRNSDV